MGRGRCPVKSEYLIPAAQPRVGDSIWASSSRRTFAKITNPANVEDALDDVAYGLAQVCVVDGVSLDCYKRRESGRFATLKIVRSSETFPAAVVVFRTANLDDATRALASALPVAG